MKKRIFSGAFYGTGFWFRVFGFGLSVQDRRARPPLFSERYGYVRYLYLGNWKLKLLSPNKP